jgi:hypothetical protein
MPLPSFLRAKGHVDHAAAGTRCRARRDNRSVGRLALRRRLTGRPLRRPSWRGRENRRQYAGDSPGPRRGARSPAEALQPVPRLHAHHRRHRYEGFPARPPAGYQPRMERGGLGPVRRRPVAGVVRRPPVQGPAPPRRRSPGGGLHPLLVLRHQAPGGHGGGRVDRRDVPPALRRCRPHARVVCRHRLQRRRVVRRQDARPQPVRGLLPRHG